MDIVIEDYVNWFLNDNFIYYDNGYDELVRDKTTNEDLTFNQLKFVIFKIFNGDELKLENVIGKWWYNEKQKFIPVEE